MTIYTYTEARQNLALLLEQAAKEGGVQIRRRDGSVFTLRPEVPKGSPLDVGMVKTDVTKEEIVSVIREGRERNYLQSKTGEICPKSGVWYVEGTPSTTAPIAKGNQMPPYGGRAVTWVLVQYA